MPALACRKRQMTTSLKGDNVTQTMGFACSLPNSEVLFEFNRSLSLGSGNSSLHGFLHGRDRIWKCCNRSGRRTGALCVQPTHSGAARAIHLRSFNRKMACLSSVFSAVNAPCEFWRSETWGSYREKEYLTAINIHHPSTDVSTRPLSRRLDLRRIWSET